MTDTVTLILEIIGTIAFAISGALVGIEKRMDILGVAIPAQRRLSAAE